ARQTVVFQPVLSGDGDGPAQPADGPSRCRAQHLPVHAANRRSAHEPTSGSYRLRVTRFHAGADAYRQVDVETYERVERNRRTDAAVDKPATIDFHRGEDARQRCAGPKGDVERPAVE